MADGWYILSDGGTSGPFHEQALLEQRCSGQIKDDDQISADRSAWISARDFFEETPGSEQGGYGNAPRESAGGVDNTIPAERTGARDRIVVLGRRRAGKTIYLSTLYARLWKSLDGMTMSSLSGVAHREAMRVVSLLENGKWPEATGGTAEMAYELEYHGRKRLMVSLEYSGEVFRRAFVDDDHQDPQVQQLLNHLDNAAAVILLMDPNVVYEHSKFAESLRKSEGIPSDGPIGVDYTAIDAAVDDDYGMVQTVKRVRNWPGGEHVPIVLVLTKMDQNRHLVKKEGGSVSFVTNHWPALGRTLKKLPIFSISAVQAVKGPDGQIAPSRSSEPHGLEKPLKVCLKVMDKFDQLREVNEAREAQERSRREIEKRMAEEEQHSKKFWTIVIIAILMLGAFIIGLIIVFR